MPLQPRVQRLCYAGLAAGSLYAVYLSLGRSPAPSAADDKDDEEEDVRSTAAASSSSSPSTPSPLSSSPSASPLARVASPVTDALGRLAAAISREPLLPGASQPAECFFSLRGDAGVPPPLASMANPAPFESVYELLEKLGHGAFATVHKCLNKASKEVAAVKVFDLSKADPDMKERIKRSVGEEVSILRSLAHPSIVQVFDVFDGPERVHFVMEFCQGGELFDRIVARTTYNEKDARDVIRTLLEALAYCHDRQIVHRDLKPENLLLEDKECDNHIKLADFGAAARLRRPNGLRRYCGTPGYTAPEILKGLRYGERVDCWSAGIIAYILLGGYPPFQDSEDQVEKKSIFQFHSPEWDNVSKEAKDLIRQLLVVDPADRLTAKDALQAEDDELAGRDLDRARQGIQQFNARRKLRGAIKAVIATNRIKYLLQREEEGED